MSTIEGTAGGAGTPETAPPATGGSGVVTSPPQMTARAAGVPLGRLAAVVLWLCVGHAMLGGLYWLLLNVPESNVLMLVASALLALVVVIGFGVVDTTALLWLRPDWPLGRAMRRGLRVLPAFLLALGLWLLIAWVCGRLERYHSEHGGELDAWLIATFDWTRNAWLHRTIDYVLDVVHYVIGTSLAVSLLSSAAAESAVEVVRLRWIARGLHWLQLVVVAVAIFGLVWLPWQAVYWRPASLPASSVQVAFAIAKLIVLGVLMHVGWALVLWAPQMSRRLRG